MKVHHMSHYTIEMRLGQVAILNLTLLWSQPKLCEDPVSFSFCLFSLLNLIFLILSFGILDMFKCVSFKFRSDTREEHL